MRTPSFLTICAICGADGRFNDKFMDVVCDKCAGMTSADIAENVAKFEPQEHNLSTIMQKVCAKSGLTEAEIKTKNRHPRVNWARTVFMTLARKKTKLSYQKIADEIGVDRVTVMWASKTADRLLETNKKFAVRYGAILCQP